MAPSLRLLHYSDLENVHDRPERAGRFTQLVDRHRDDRTLIIGTGDSVAPSALSLLTRGRGALELFRQIRPAVDTFGNHEFDYGLERARELADESPQQWVCANIRAADGSIFGAQQGVEPWTVLSVGDCRVGVFGATTPDVQQAALESDGLSVRPPADTTRDALAALESEGVDVTVGLLHTGTAESLAQSFDVDVLCDGHTREVTADVVAGTLVSRPGGLGKDLMEVDLGQNQVTRHMIDTADPDPTVTRAYRERRRHHGLNEQVASLDAPLARSPPDGEVLHPIETTIADACRTATDSDAALVPSGGFRAGDQLPKQVTATDLLSVAPYDDKLVVTELTGRDLETVLDSAVRAGDGVNADDPSIDPVLAPSGLQVTVTEHGEPVTVSRDGRPLQSSRPYRVAVPDYLVNTEYFPWIDESTVVRETDVLLCEVLLEHVRKHGLRTAVDDRITVALMDKSG